MENKNIHPDPQTPRLIKLVLNFGLGAQEYKQVLVNRFLNIILPNRKPVLSRARVTNKEFGIKKGQVIGIHITVRGAEARRVLAQVLTSRKMIPRYSITNEGSVSFGVENVNYIDNIDIQSSERIGADVCFFFRKIGEKVRTRKRARGKIPQRHLPKTQEIIDELKKLGVRCE